MNLLITGGSGFIGARLVGELLDAGHEVAIFDLAGSVAHPDRCIRGDVRDREALTVAAAGRDTIIHLAAEHRDDARSASLCDQVNVGGSENVVAAARQANCRRIIFVSSVAVYPLNVRESTEEAPPRPYNRYGQSKLKAEQVFRQWALSSPGAALVMVRACVVFGEGNRGNVYNLLRQIHRRRFVMVGRGRNRKSIAYVGNLTRFLATCLDAPSGVHLYNYADKPDFSAAELVGLVNRALGRSTSRFRLPYFVGLAGGLAYDALARLTGRDYPLSSARVRKFCAETTISTQRLERTGFVRPYALEEALVQTVRHEFQQSGPS